MKSIILVGFLISFYAFAYGQTCGLEGTIDERVHDCSLLENSVKGYYVLVTRAEDFTEIYKDTRTGLIWGDRLPSTVEFYDAGLACSSLSKFDKSSWRWPTIEEFETANSNGIRSALPNMNYMFWSSSFYQFNWRLAWTFNGVEGARHRSRVVNAHSVRCVAD